MEMRIVVPKAALNSGMKARSARPHTFVEVGIGIEVRAPVLLLALFKRRGWF
jgi:hypothetical protein